MPQTVWESLMPIFETSELLLGNLNQFATPIGPFGNPSLRGAWIQFIHCGWTQVHLVLRLEHVHHDTLSYVNVLSSSQISNPFLPPGPDTYYPSELACQNVSKHRFVRCILYFVQIANACILHPWLSILQLDNMRASRQLWLVSRLNPVRWVLLFQLNCFFAVWPRHGHFIWVAKKLFIAGRGEGGETPCQPQVWEPSFDIFEKLWFLRFFSLWRSGFYQSCNFDLWNLCISWCVNL